ncbi:4Fe-4S dicluster domain-containing protein [Desulfobacula sp.]|uniref:4Fe-4S dicluster domain-containing protein n=1 Tax=Desulfobacula sp. TaxID=2593537 RepID=UPI002631A764|nr:4Fe-4S dicluster domain-containing protein [Desulfobacula sp.]
MGQANNKGYLEQTETIKTMIQTCIQCGTCTASCPNIEFMDITPRHMWRLLMTDHVDQLFSSKSFIMCSSCYYCTLRCPRGLELTNAMSQLKQVASKLRLKQFRRSSLFYEAFLNSVKNHGRVKEMEFMTNYFISMKNPVIPFAYASLGIKLLAKGKIRPEFSFGRKGKLTALFKKVAELEE